MCLRSVQKGVKGFVGEEEGTGRPFPTKSLMSLTLLTSLGSDERSVSQTCNFWRHFVVVKSGVGSAISTWQVEAMDEAKHPTVHRTVPPTPKQRLVWPQVPAVPRWGNPALEGHRSTESEPGKGLRDLRHICIQLSHFTAQGPEIQRGEDTSQGHTASKWQSWSGTQIFCLLRLTYLNSPQNCGED